MDRYFQVKLDEASCSLCEVCARRCPTAALTVRRVERTLELLFDHRSCHGCSGEAICIEVCPERSIDLVQTTESPAAPMPVLLLRGEMVDCRRCGALFAPQRKLRAVQQRPVTAEERVREHCPDCRRTLLLGGYPLTDAPPSSEG